MSTPLSETTLCLLVQGRLSAEVLLGLKREGFGAVKHTGCGGKVEAEETPAAAAIRELVEEKWKDRKCVLELEGHMWCFPCRGGECKKESG
jgi:8-oxo-dGTP pyrophosphatase MutT (NUDIX family)